MDGVDSAGNPFKADDNEFEPLETESATPESSPAQPPAAAPQPFVFGARPLAFPPAAAAPAAAPDTASYLDGYGSKPAGSFVATSVHSNAAAPRNGAEAFFHRVSSTYKSSLDSLIPHVKARWIFTGVLFVLYLLRAFLYLDGWYIVSYALGIYLLNLVVRFLSPLVDPDEGNGALLPTRTDDEFRPFMRQLPEFKFWVAGTRAMVAAMLATFFDAFNVPVFWPILLVYFFTLFYMTMSRQIAHMRKHNYVPWSFGKRTYAK